MLAEAMIERVMSVADVLGLITIGEVFTIVVVFISGMCSGLN